MNFDSAKLILEDCVRHELRDHAFGDVEITWYKGPREIATGYFGGGHASVTLSPETTFEGEMALMLLDCGTVGHIERNDETGPEEFKLGQTKPELTKEFVRREIAKPPGY